MHVIGPIVLLTGGVFLLAGAAVWPLGSVTRPGPGLFPFLGGMGLMALAALLPRPTPRADGIARLPSMLVLGATAAFALGVDRLGVLPSACLVAVASALALGGGWRLAIAVGLVVASGVTLVFVVALRVPFAVLPVGFPP